MFLLLSLDELKQRSGCGVRYRPTIEAVCVPIHEIVALVTESLLFRDSVRISFPAHEQAHVMVFEPIDQHGNVFTSYIVESSAYQFKALMIQVLHRWYEIVLASNSRIDGRLSVLVDIVQM